MFPIPAPGGAERRGLGRSSRGKRRGLRGIYQISREQQCTGRRSTTSKRSTQLPKRWTRKGAHVQHPRIRIGNPRRHSGPSVILEIQQSTIKVPSDLRSSSSSAAGVPRRSRGVHQQAEEHFGSISIYTVRAPRSRREGGNPRFGHEHHQFGLRVEATERNINEESLLMIAECKKKHRYPLSTGTFSRCTAVIFNQKKNKTNTTEAFDPSPCLA